MKSYVVGFAFSEDKEHVLLIEKLRPAWQKNSLNGIGGKIEGAEEPKEAMDRECMEETGLCLEWEQRGIMSGINGDGKPFECHIFYAYSNTISNFEQREDEPLNVYAVKELHDKKMIKNLRFLIPFGQHNDAQEFIRLEYK
ncbi:NUDIX domain-containing protein [Sulfurimonas microaerophilic]|uniref:NUDIX domain-containing protein n=1 Tax=Sulfurimonas microaerophilic TaxID=3058392 RepID=UPI002714F05D|nr:NUDIX domain-containing protein [Sulfurimonas sp. hsl 1-7]